jgi:CubicO group peptidase (beta-lactamase class C family)
MKNPLLLSIIAIILSMTLLSCEKDDNLTPDPNPDGITTPAELTAALADIYDGSDAPGFAVSVIKSDVLLYQQSFGKADIEGRKAYSNQTTQPIGSISKTFVAAAIVKAIEQGHFTLETDINDILPVEVKNPKQPNAVIKVRHLVTHTSGLLDNDEAYLQAYHILPGEDLSTEGSQLLTNGFGVQQRESIPLEAFLAEYYLDDGNLYRMDNFASTAPGSTWNYSNIAASLAAYLVEAATGTPFKAYVTTNILQPLGMTKTAYDLADLNPANAAKLYWDDSTPLPNYANDSYPDGSINTCNEDLAKYLLDMMKGAKGQSTALFSKQGYEMLFGALLPDGRVPASLAKNQGVFWFLDDNIIRHDGSDPGTTCNFLFDKTSDSGYLLMTNMDASTDEHGDAYFQLAGRINNAIAEFILNN